MDRQAFAENLDAWGRTPVSGYVIGGSTGEAPLLDPEELMDLVALAADRVSDRRIVAGTGCESTRATLRHTVVAARHGATAALVRPPTYYRSDTTPEGLREHFLTVAEESPIPLILYHVPKFVPTEMLPDLVGELARHERVIGIKDSSGDIKNLGALAAVCAGKADVLVGSGSLLYAGLEIGAAGGMVAVGLLAAELCCDCYEAFGAGRTLAAGKLQERIGPLDKAVVGKHGVPGVKFALDRLGFHGGPPRPPLRPVGAKARTRIAAALERAGVLDRAAATEGRNS